MKVKTKYGDFDVKEVTLSEQRELHRAELKSLDVSTGKLDVDRWMDLLDRVAEMAFGSEEKAWEEMAHLKQEEIDLVLTDIQAAWQNPPKKSKGG